MSANRADVAETSDPIILRLERVYKALDAVSEFDGSKIKIHAFRTDEPAPEAGPNVRKQTVRFDFRGGATDADLSNWLNQAIAMVASLKDHLKKWAKKNGKDSKTVEQFFTGSKSLCILMDLWNTDKHTSGRDSWSGHYPELRNFRRSLKMRMDPGDQPRQSIKVDVSGGELRFPPGSRHSVDTSADVCDRNGATIGDAREILEEAIKEIEGFLRTLGLSVREGE
jgi:hypothetical protein